MNVNFKVYWNNPIEMSTEAGTQQLTFEVPLGAIISNPSEVTTPYPSFIGNADKVLTVNATEDDVEWTTPVTQVYVDTQDSLLQDQIDLKADAMAISQSLTLKADLINGLIPASQLPSYVDDVLNFPDLVSFPSVGEDGKIYIAENTNKTYRWGGSSYVEVGDGGVALGETIATAYRGDRGKIAYDHSQSQGNPHNMTTSDINEGTKLFFTEPRVNQTVLTGLNTSIATPALATDQLLAAIGKLQAQINNIAPTWVALSTVATIPSYIIDSTLQVARINGLLWLRGTFRLSMAVESHYPLASFTDAMYKSYSYHLSNIGRRLNLSTIYTASNSQYSLAYSSEGNVTNASQAASTRQTLEFLGFIQTSAGVIMISPVALGELVIK